MDFSTHKPVRIITGTGCVCENASLFAECGKKAIVVSGHNSADRSGAMADVAAALEKCGIPYVRYAEITENPPAPVCCAGGELARREGCDFVIAIGGGSALDSGKAIAGYAANPDCGVVDIYDDSKRVNDCLPIICIPTTSGTGSEACRYAVLTIDGGIRKKTFRCSTSYPKYSFVDPRYSSTMSDDCTVSTALDVLSHAIESYLSPKANEVSSAAASFAASEVWDILFRQNKSSDWTDTDRERLAYAATSAGIAIDYTGTGFPHPLGYSITLTRGTPHGKACAIFEGAYIRYNMLKAEGAERLNAIASDMGTTPSEMEELIPAKSGVHFTIPADERESLIDRVSGAGNYANSPYVISRGEMSDIFERIFG